MATDFAERHGEGKIVTSTLNPRAVSGFVEARTRLKFFQRLVARLFTGRAQEMQKGLGASGVRGTLLLDCPWIKCTVQGFSKARERKLVE
jgi:hypothetical protein